MWTLPALGFARRRKAKQSKNETPLILVYAGGAVKTLGLHRPAFLFGKSMRSIVALSLHAVGSSTEGKVATLLLSLQAGVPELIQVCSSLSLCPGIHGSEHFLTAEVRLARIL